MEKQEKKWEILGKSKAKDIIKVLLLNRGITSKTLEKEFFEPCHPEKLTLRELKIKEVNVKKAIDRIRKARKNKEKIIVYGDYDADGICATAILWEALFAAGMDALPYIPDRFSEGYGINIESVNKLKKLYPKLGLVVTVDNGIVANKEIKKINKLGIDVIVTDHHQIGKKLPKAYSIIHTDTIGGAEIAWIFARKISSKFPINDTLELAAIGTIADQLPLIGPNRSFAKHGIEALRKTKRPGLLALYKEASIASEKVGTYEINYMIAPRINAMGRLANGLESLRLLCTKDGVRAEKLANYLGKTNYERQRIVDEVVMHARETVGDFGSRKVLILSHESYHEGVIGLAASKLVEEFYRPAIVISKGKKISKASARSISGFNIIENIRKLEGLLHGGGGHPMAAGFSILTSDIEVFTQKFEEISTPLLTDEVLTKKLKIDLEIDFESVTQDLYKKLHLFEPTGLGNPTPVFLTNKVMIVDARNVGRDASHLKLKLEKGGKIFDAIGFGLGNLLPQFSPSKKLDIVYSIEENIWNGNTNLQLKIKDLRMP